MGQWFRDTAEEYAASDPATAWQYRDEAAEFCSSSQLDLLPEIFPPSTDYIA